MDCGTCCRKSHKSRAWSREDANHRTCGTCGSKSQNLKLKTRSRTCGLSKSGRSRLRARTRTCGLVLPAPPKVGLPSSGLPAPPKLVLQVPDWLVESVFFFFLRAALKRGKQVCVLSLATHATENKPAGVVALGSVSTTRYMSQTKHRQGCSGN